MIEAPVSESKSGVREMLSKRCRYPSRSAPRHWPDHTRRQRGPTVSRDAPLIRRNIYNHLAEARPAQQLHVAVRCWMSWRLTREHLPPVLRSVLHLRLQPLVTVCQQRTAAKSIEHICLSPKEVRRSISYLYPRRGHAKSWPASIAAAATSRRTRWQRL
jgi:hypothetical protein